MLESVLADVLTRVLGQYLEGIDRDSVRFGAWSGLVELRGVALRPEALAVLFETLGLELPVTVEAGFIGLLRLQVPWKSIGTTPVQIHMEDITIIARPVRGDGSDNSELENRDRRIKRAKLDTDDAVREASWGVSAEDDNAASASWSSWLVSDQLRAKIVDNIQIHLKDIILRFEDHFSNPQRPYIASVACKALRAVSVNEQWVEAFVERDVSSDTRKLLEVIGFRIDWAPITPENTPGHSQVTGSDNPAPTRFKSADLLKRFLAEDGNHASDSAAATKRLLHSVDGSMRLRLTAVDKPLEGSQELRDQNPAVDLDIRFPEILVDLNDVQYSSILQTSVYFARLATRGIRPQTPKARWVWAIDQLLPGFSRRRAQALRFTEKGITEARDKRILYVACRTALLKARRNGLEEPKDMAEQLEAIEDQLSYEEVLAYRDRIDRMIEIGRTEWPRADDKNEVGVADNSQGTTTSSFWRMLGYSDQPAATSGEALSSEPKSDPKINVNALDDRRRLSLRVGFLLHGATLKLCQGGYPGMAIERVALRLQRLRVGVLYSSIGELIVESVVGGIEAWDIYNNVRMVYSRLVSEAASDSGESADYNESYPQDVSDAIEAIRSGSNPARDVLLEEESHSAEGQHLALPAQTPYEYDHDPITTDFRNLADETSPASSSEPFRAIRTEEQDSLPMSTYRVTEAEFLGNPRNTSGVQNHIAAFRFTKNTGVRANGDISGLAHTMLEVSVATLEAVIDGPKGSFLWGLKFWKPKGMVRDPIMAFLGAAAGARIAELRIELEEVLLANRVPMQINAVIMAPRFIIPGSAPLDPAFVVNMGTLGICTSDSAPNTLSQPASSKTKLARYSNYVLTLDDLGVYFCPGLSTAVSRGLDMTDIESAEHPKQRSQILGRRTIDTTDVERVIRPFSLRFVLQSLRDSSIVQVAHSSREEKGTQSNDIAKVRLRGDIPGLSVILTLKAFQHLAAATQAWSEELYPRNVETSDTYDITEAKTVSQGEFVAPGGSSQSLQFSESPFTMKPTSSQEDAGERERRLTSLASYDVNVRMQKVSIDIRQTSDMRLVTASADEMITNVVKTGRKSVTAEFSLRSFSVIDGSRGSTAAFRRLLYAGSLSGPRAVSPPRSVGDIYDESKLSGIDGENFVNIRYNLNLLSNEQEVSLRFLSLKMVCVRETYAHIGIFFSKVREYMKSRRKRRRTSASEEQMHLSVRNLANTVDQVKAKIPDTATSVFGGRRLSVISEFDGFHLQLVASGGAIADVEMKDSRVYFHRYRGSRTKLWGDFQFFSIRDLTAPVDEHVPVVTYRRSSTSVKDAVTSGALGEEPDREHADEWSLTLPSTSEEAVILNAAFRRIKILFLSRFADVVRQYISVLLSELHPVMMGSIDEEDELTGRLSTAPLTLRVLMTVELRDLSLRLPRHSSCCTEALNITFSSIELANVYRADGRIEWESCLHDLQMATEYILLDNGDTQKNMSVSSTFLTGVEANVVLRSDAQSTLQSEGGVSDRVKLVRVNLASPVRVNLCEAQYTVLYFILTENFAETISGLEVSTSASNTTGFDGGMCEAPLSSDQLKSDINTSDMAHDMNNFPTLESESLLIESRKETAASCEVVLPFISVEVSRGWDVTQEDCKVFGVYLRDVRVGLKRFYPFRLLVELEGHLIGMSDLRMERRTEVRNVAIPLSRPRLIPTEGNAERKGNFSITYDKEGSERPAIVVYLTELELELSKSLFRDFTYLAVPGWPFLRSSWFAPEIVYLGRTMNVLLSESQLVLRADESDNDCRALVLTGEFLVKVDWKRVTGAKRVSIRSSQVEISTTMALPSPFRHSDCFGVEAYTAEKLKRSETPLAYPTDSFLEYVGPDVDEGGRRVEFSVDAFLCVVCVTEIPLLKAVVTRACSSEDTYLTTRNWVQPAFGNSSVQDVDQSLTPKQKQTRIARESINASIIIPAARYLFTDDRDGHFVSILEARLSSLSIQAHGESMVQVGGEVSLDLFNADKGWWEPAIETWNLTASMSRGQSGTRAFVVRSDQRLNVNITPTTVSASLTVAKALKSATKKSVKSENRKAHSSTVSQVGGHADARRPSIAAFLVRNELGIPVTMSLPTSSRKTQIANNTEAEVGAQSESLLASTGTNNGRLRAKALRCSISIPSSRSLEVSASEMGIYPLKFFPGKEGTEDATPKNSLEPVQVVWDVRMVHGVPVCTVRSPLRVRNDTRTTLEINISRTRRSASEEASSSKRITRLEPGRFASISLLDMQSEIMVRPSLSEKHREGNTFEWSSPLPSYKWLKKTAYEVAQVGQSTRKSPSTMSMRMKRTRHTLACRSQQNDGCDFYVAIAPRTSQVYAPRTVASVSWVDVALKAPVVLENKLPGPLGYRVFQRDTLAALQALKEVQQDGAVLAAGVVKPLQDVHLHFSRDSTDSTYISLAYDNNVVLQDFGYGGAKRALSEFGSAFNLSNLNPGTAVRVDVSPNSSSRNQTRRVFMASLLPNRNGTGLKAFAGFWVRNRSDTDVEICSRNSFYGTGSVSHILRQRPPSVEPDNYVCCEGPYLSIRPPGERGSSNDDRPDHTNWWTSPTALDDIDKPINVALPGRALELEVRPSLGLDCQTSVVTIRNTTWIVNSTHLLLQWCQASALDAHGNCRTRLLNTLQPGESQGVHWEAKSSLQGVHLRLAQPTGQSDWIWSPAIPVNIGFSRELPAKMYRPKTHEQYIARVMLKEIAGNSRALVIFEEDRQNPPYKIINLCKERAVAFRQTGSQERHWLVRAGKTTRYSWDDPLAPRKERLLSVRIVEAQELFSGNPARSFGSSSSQRTPSQGPPYELNIDVVGDSTISSADFGEHVTASISVDGATKVVTFTEAGAGAMQTKDTSTKEAQSYHTEDTRSDPVPVVGWDEIRRNPYEERRETNFSVEGLCDYPRAPASSKVRIVRDSANADTDVAVFLESLGISVVDAEPCEIMYVRYTGILCNYQSHAMKECFSLSIAQLQADNQLYKTPFPVLMCISSDGEDDKDPVLSDTTGNLHAVMLEIHRDITRDDILMITSFQAVVRASNLYLEDRIITRLIHFLSDSALANHFAKTEVLAGQDQEHLLFVSWMPTGSQELTGDENIPKHKRQIHSTTTSRRIYLRDFGISSSSLRLTSAGSGTALARAAGMPASVRTIVGMLLNVDNCEFLFAPLSVQNVFDSVHHFVVLIREYYVAQLTSQRMKLLASNSLVGNPAALFDAVGTGARDFFSEPGRAKGSADFIASVGRGSKSLFSHTVGGIVESVSGIPRALSSGIEAAVGDKDYLAERQRIRGLGSTAGHRGSAARNPAQGLATGAVSFAHGISSGVHGLIREPVQGARQGGASGLLKGIGKAFIGGVAKPVAGAIDLVAEPAAGLSRQIGGSERSRNEIVGAIPDRPPRAFRGRNPRLETYDRRYALGAFIYQAVQTVSGVSYDSPLIEWVELSKRSGRKAKDSDLWVWDIVQRFARKVPGAKTQSRKDEIRPAQDQGAGSAMDMRPEKTRVALVTETDVVIATLDCKLVMVVPLWEDANYHISGDGKELVITADMALNAKPEKDDLSGSQPGSQPLITAPWDASIAGMRRKPSPGSRSLDRIACGSFEARDDLRRLLGEVVTSLAEASKGYGSWSASEGKRSSAGVELTCVDKWNSANETEMRSSDHKEHLTTADISRLHWTGSGTTSWGGGGRSEKIRTEASLEKRVRRLSMSGSRKGGDSRHELRMILANKLGSGMTMRLTSSKLDHGVWKCEVPSEIETLDAQILEADGDAGEGTSGKEVSGAVVYEIISQVDKKAVGQVIVEFFRGRDEAASFTTRATAGYQAEFVSGGSKHGTAIFNMIQSHTDERGSKARKQESGSSSGGNYAMSKQSKADTSDHEASNTGLSEDEQVVQQLVDIGFKFEDAVVALAEVGGDIVKAVDILTQQR